MHIPMSVSAYNVRSFQKSAIPMRISELADVGWSSEWKEALVSEFRRRKFPVCAFLPSLSPPDPVPPFNRFRPSSLFLHSPPFSSTVECGLLDIFRVNL